MKYFIFGLVLFLFGCSPAPVYKERMCLKKVDAFGDFIQPEVLVLRTNKTHYKYSFVIPWNKGKFVGQDTYAMDAKYINDNFKPVDCGNLTKAPYE